MVLQDQDWTPCSETMQLFKKEQIGNVFKTKARFQSVKDVFLCCRCVLIRSNNELCVKVWVRVTNQDPIIHLRSVWLSPSGHAHGVSGRWRQLRLIIRQEVKTGILRNYPDEFKGADDHERHIVRNKRQELFQNVLQSNLSCCYLISVTIFHLNESVTKSTYFLTIFHQFCVDNSATVVVLRVILRLRGRPWAPVPHTEWDQVELLSLFGQVVFLIHL